MPLTKVSQAMSNSFGRKNIIINGDMRIDQRLNQATASTVSARTYFCDRLSNTGFIGYTMNFTQSLVTETSNQVFSRYINNTVAVNSGAVGNSYAPFYYVVEGNDIAHLKDKQVTFSFDIRTSTAGTFAVMFRTTGASASYITEVTVNAANTIERKTITLTLDSTVGTWDWSTGVGVNIEIGAIANATYSTATLNTWQAGNFITSTTALDWSLIAGFTMDISNMQLEAGSVATPFEHIPYAEELRLCQRYYEQYQYGWTLRYSTAASMYDVSYVVPKRVAATVQYTVSSGAASASLLNNTTKGCTIYLITVAATYVTVCTADAEL